MNVLGINLPDKLSTSSTRGEHEELSTLFFPPYGDNEPYLELASSHHGGDGGMFCTKTSTGACIDTDAMKMLASLTDEDAGNVPNEAISNPVWT